MIMSRLWSGIQNTLPRLLKEISIGLTIMSVVCLTVLAQHVNFGSVTAASITASDEHTITITNTRADTTVIGNRWGSINQFDPSDATWRSTANQQPANSARTRYPFLRYVELFAATGGCYRGYPGCTMDVDLLADPSAATSPYQFARLLENIAAILRQGLKPYIVTGNVPVVMSSHPYIGYFGINVRPPADYTRYQAYIAAVGASVVARYGHAEVATWRWGVLTEFNNLDWFDDGVSPASTATAYLKLYDHTVAALAGVLGAGQVNIGAHACTSCTNSWNVDTFIDHVAKGSNYVTGRRGTEIHFLSNSYYDVGVGAPGTLATFTDSITVLRSHAEAVGLRHLRYGIDEGRLLQGPDGKDLGSRSVGNSYQASYDAFLFQQMLATHTDWYSRWSVNTNTLWGQSVDTVATHVAQLSQRMINDRQLVTQTTGQPANSTDIVASVGGYNETLHQVHVMAFNHNPALTATTTEPLTIQISGVRLAAGQQVVVREWIIDDTHAQFWPTWWHDMEQHGIPDDHFFWSRFSENVTTALNQRSDGEYFISRLPMYQQLATLQMNSKIATVEQATVTITTTLAPHAVVFYEIDQITLR